ncbi:MAG: alpha-galactosidase, partial [Verrucomicrobia bacterium]|nr:alpha-galactosidase [Verrucomicrobiota bacterium]
GGQWAAEFRRGGRGSVRIKAGQELTHFTLHPGEEVRTPLIALLFYQGDRIRSQNIWRRWMIAHNLPRPHGKLPAPMLCGVSFCYFAPWGFSNAQSQKIFMDVYEARKLPIDTWWIDAGWYNCDASLSTTGYSIWNRTGTWEPDRRRFPNGVREVNDYAHKKGLKTILWFEPERVWRPGTWLAEEHPEWLLKAAPDPNYVGADKNTRLLNLGNPAALRWLINHVSGLLTSERVDIYREDCNMDPLPFWRANDAKNRQGITEIRHVMGHLAFWDELRRRHPTLLIDCVSSGSKRIELEAFRRAVTLTRSDYIPGLTWKESNTTRLAANQSMIYGISSWIPYHGIGFGANQIDAYRFRCFMSPGLGLDFDPRSDTLDEDLWRRLMAQFKQVAPYYFGDYYPMTPYSLERNVWMAWQFDCPEKGEGMVQAFRREQSRRVSLRLKLRGLCPERIYIVTNLDDNRTLRLTGRTLMAEGLPVTLKNRSASGLWIYRRAGQKKT